MNNEIRGKSRFCKNLIITRNILDAINLIEYNLEKTTDEKQWHFNIGELESLKELYNKSLKTVYDQITSINNELIETEDDPELFEMHREYLRGYQSGCVKIIRTHRDHKQYVSDIRILVYTQDEGLKDLLIALFSIAGFENDETLSSDLSVCVSNNIDLLNKLTDLHDSYKFIVTMSAIKNVPLRLDKSQRQDIDKIKKELSDKFNYTHDKEEHLLDVINVLNAEWLDANFVYMPSLISAEQVFQLMISSMRVKY